MPNSTSSSSSRPRNRRTTPFLVGLIIAQCRRSLSRFMTTYLITPVSLVSALFLVAMSNIGLSTPPPSLTLDLYPGDAPGLVAGGKAETFLNERFQNVSKPQMSVWLPEKGKSNGTALIICAGGGYHHLAMGLHVENVAELLTHNGIAVIGLKYRTRYGANDVVEDALADGKRAVRLTRSHATAWRIDPGRVGVQGYSAGANLCLNLAGRFDSGNPASADLVERLSSRPDFVVLMCPWPNSKTIVDYPLRKNTPPVFIAHARDDSTAPFGFAVAIQDKLKELGIANKLHAVDTGGHSAFHYRDAKDTGHGWPDVLLPWLESIGMFTSAPTAQP